MNYAERREADFLEFFGVEYPYNLPPQPEFGERDKNHVAVEADLHLPYDSLDVKRVLERSDAETLIIAGDLTDYYSKCRFRKTRYQDFRDELRTTFYYLEWCYLHFPKTYVMMGNHDNRPQKLIADIFDGQADLQILTEPNILARLVSYFPTIELVGIPIDRTDGHGRARETSIYHIWQFGDVVFTHGEMSRKQSSAICAYISDYLHRWRGTLKLKPYSVIMQGHNHRAYKEPVGDELWMLIPTASARHSIGNEYVVEPKMIGNPPAIGYCDLYQVEGKTDWNKTNWTIL